MTCGLGGLRIGCDDLASDASEGVTEGHTEPELRPAYHVHMARNRSKLPAGWSRPIKPSEVTQTFPGIGHVYWNGRPTTWRDNTAQPVIWLTWDPRTAMPQPILTVWAVPSANRAAIRQWIQQAVAPQATRWLLALESRSPTWRDTRQSKTWTWRPDLEGEPGPGGRSR